MIKTYDLCMQFNNKPVLNHIDLEVHQGEIFGLLGPSGAGKTTLIHLLTGQIAPTGGQVLLHGLDGKQLDAQFYRQTGIMLDCLGLYERLSCLDNLMLYAKIKRQPKSAVYRVLEQVGLAQDAKKPVSKLSKGMAQRISFARAILGEPKLLFLDEPTNGLDPATSAILHQIILDLQKKGTTVFLTTHDMMEAYKLCNHIALINAGVIAEYGVPKELCLKYDIAKQIKITTKQGKEVCIANSPLQADVLAAYLQNGTMSIHTSEPTLEGVFMQVTGRTLS